MEILNEDLCNAPVLVTLDVSNSAAQIVVGVDASFRGEGRSNSNKINIRTNNDVAVNVGFGTKPRSDIMWRNMSAMC